MRPNIQRLLRVNLVILTMRRSLPVYLGKQTFSEPVGTSHSCQQRMTSLVRQPGRAKAIEKHLLSGLVGREIERTGGFDAIVRIQAQDLRDRRSRGIHLVHVAVQGGEMEVCGYVSRLPLDDLVQ